MGPAYGKLWPQGVAKYGLQGLVKYGLQGLAKYGFSVWIQGGATYGYKV